MKDTISILSLNVNGLRDEVKRIRLFRWLKNNRFDLIFLQDVRWSEEDGESWSSQWGRLSCWQPQVAILASGVGASLVMLEGGNDRLLFCQFEAARALPLVVGSIYVPADRGEHVAWLLALEGTISLDIDILG